MTVQELIEKLQVIEDKSRICLVRDSDGSFLWEIKPEGIFDWNYQHREHRITIVFTCVPRPNKRER